MPTFDTPELLDALSAPVGDLITSVGTSVAAAQRAMDSASLDALQEIYERDEAQFHLLQSIGYKPTWYQIPEVDAEISIALTVTGSHEETGRSASRVKLYAAPVDAGYTSRFGFELQASSKVRFKVVPVPPSTAAEALQGADALVLVTEWNEFRHVDPEEIKVPLNQPVLFDGRNIFDPARMREAGFTYYGIGVS